MRKLGITLLLLPISCFGLQTKLVMDNAKIVADVAKHELNRVMVEKDRISQIFGLDGRFSIETEEETGQIFIQPASDKQIHLTLITEKGQSVDLTLNPIDSTPETILLKLQKESLQEVQTTSSGHPVTQSLTELIVAMAQGRGVKGYQRAYESIHVSLWRDMKVVLVGQYQGDQFVGEIYQIKNQSKSAKVLDEKQFLLEANVAAIALEHYDLAPQDTTMLYLVKRAEV